MFRLGLFRIFYPCLMIFGTIGNILCLKILLKKRFRRQSTCQYLSILAVIDILFIYMRSTRHLYRQIYNLDLRNKSLWICRSLIFFSSALSQLASWILVVVSFDRYFIIKSRFPHRHIGWRVLKSTSILILIVFAANFHYFHILGKIHRTSIDSIFVAFFLFQDNKSLSKIRIEIYPMELDRCKTISFALLVPISTHFFVSSVQSLIFYSSRLFHLY